MSYSSIPFACGSSYLQGLLCLLAAYIPLPLFHLLQALADFQLHPICRPLLHLRHLCYVLVPLAQVPGQRARVEMRREPDAAHRHPCLLAQGITDGDSPSFHGVGLLPCVCGEWDQGGPVCTDEDGKGKDGLLTHAAEVAYKVAVL